MVSNDTQPTRRGVLKSTGVAVSAAIGATAISTGSASAQLEPMDCAETVVKYSAYEDACPVDGYVGEVPVGVYGQVIDTCTDSDGTRWVYFRSAEMNPPSAWIYEGNLMEKPCE